MCGCARVYTYNMYMYIDLCGGGGWCNTMIKTHNTRGVVYIYGFLCRARIIIIIIIIIAAARVAARGSQTTGVTPFYGSAFVRRSPGDAPLRRIYSATAAAGSFGILGGKRARPGHSITAMGFSVSFQSEPAAAAPTRAITAPYHRRRQLTGGSFSRARITIQ